MKTSTRIPRLFLPAHRMTVPPVRNLVAEWQSGPETLSGYAQRKLRLSLAPLPEGQTTNKNHEHAIYFGNGNGHLPLWWIPR
jgi:hypothetical protein